MTVVLSLPGCRSLKEKRQRLKGMRERFGRNTQLAVCESGANDVLTRAEWSFVATASDSTTVERVLQSVENDILERVDALVVSLEREWLS